jgi:hypothetical protein
MPALTAESVFAPIDRARRVALAAIARVGRPLVARREPRVALIATVSIAIAFALTAVAPLALLLAGPIVLGVPHVLADVRYLVARPGLHRRWTLWIAVGAPLVWCACGGGVRAGLVATSGALLVARGRPLVRAAGIAIAAALFALASRAGPVADLVFAHLHNFVAVALYCVWRRRTGKLHWVPLAAFAALSIALVAGAATPNVLSFPYDVGMGLVPMDLAWMGGRLAALYAFAQAVHYAVWLRLVPEEDRARPTPRSFVATWRALVGDVGFVTLVACALAAIVFAAWAFVDVLDARAAYLRAAIFHGHLEIAAGALLLVEGRLPLGAQTRVSPITREAPGSKARAPA